MRCACSNCNCHLYARTSLCVSCSIGIHEGTTVLHPRTHTEAINQAAGYSPSAELTLEKRDEYTGIAELIADALTQKHFRPEHWRGYRDLAFCAILKYYKVAE